MAQVMPSEQRRVQSRPPPQTGTPRDAQGGRDTPGVKLKTGDGKETWDETKGRGQRGAGGAGGSFPRSTPPPAPDSRSGPAPRAAAAGCDKADGPGTRGDMTPPPRR